MYYRTRTYRAPFRVRAISGWVQSKPYKPATAYCWGGHDKISDSEFYVDPLRWHQPYVMVYLDTSTDANVAQASARAYDKIISKVKGEASAMLVVNIAERKQSFDMIARRGLQLLTAARSLKALDLKGFLTAVGFKRRKTRREKTQWVRTGKSRTYTISGSKVDRDEFALRKKAKTAGSLWLEYWFGWKPLISDIHGALDVIQGVPKAAIRRTFRESGSSSYQYRTTSPGYAESRSWTVIVKYTCNVDVTNADLFKANQLGLVNPATVAWEVVPFSFLVDWFLPVSRFLESQTDTLGLSLSSIVCSTLKRGQFTQHLYGKRAYSHVSNGYQFRRTLPLTLPVPGLFDRKGTAIQSATRAATAISLLSGFFKTSKFA